MFDTHKNSMLLWNQLYVHCLLKKNVFIDLRKKNLKMSDFLDNSRPSDTLTHTDQLSMAIFWSPLQTAAAREKDLSSSVTPWPVQVFPTLPN